MPYSRYQTVDRPQIAKLVIAAAHRVSEELRDGDLSG
jgi:hypothetical protein